MTDEKIRCPACGEITLEKTGEVPFNEWECSSCKHYETDAPMMMKDQA